MSLQILPLEKIHPNPDQPRKTFYRESLEELAASIRERGVLQPIVVRPREGQDGHYEIILGERRYRASLLAGLREIPALIRAETGDDEAATDALLENFQREDMNPIEKARAIQLLLLRLSVEKVAQSLGISETTMRRILELLDLPPALQAELVARPDSAEAAVFSEGHARALLALNDDPPLQLRLAEKVKAERLTVAGLEQVIKAIRAYPAKREVFLRVSASVADQMQRSLQAHEGRKRPYRGQTARDHLRSLDRQANALADMLDERVADYLSTEELNQLLATMIRVGKQIDQFTACVRGALTRQDRGFVEMYTHCPLCGRIELVGAKRCSVCWSILRRCVDCGYFDKAHDECSAFGRAVESADAEAPVESSLSYNCREYRPRFVPKGFSLPMK